MTTGLSQLNGYRPLQIRCNKIHRAGCPASLVVQGDRDLRAGATSDRCERHSPLSDAEATAATNANADVRDAAVREYDAKAAAHFDPGVREPEGYAHVAALLGGEVGGFATCPLAAASRDAAARGTAAVRDAATRALAVPDAGPSATPSTSGAAPLDAAALSSVQMTSSTAEERASETQCCPVLRLRGGGPKRRSKDSEDEWDTGSETDDSDEMSIEEESQESEEEEVGEAMDGGYENEEEEGRETASEEQFDGKAVETSSESASGCSEDSEEDMEVESPVAVGGANEGSEDDSDPEGKTPLLSTDEPDAAGTDFQTPRSLPGTPDQGAREDSGVFSPESLSQALSDVQAQIEGAPHKPSPRKPARKRRNTRTEVESRDETSDGTPENEAAHRVSPVRV